jgi:hypothetical protein
LPDLVYREESLTANEMQVFMEYERIVGGEENVMVAELLVVENGLIVRSKVYHG